MKFFLLFFLFISFVKAQPVIELEEVVVFNKIDKENYQIKTSGKNISLLSEYECDYVTKITPQYSQEKQILDKITLFFNPIKNIKENETLLELILLSEKNDYPSEPLFDKKLSFKIKSSKKEKITINLLPLNLKLKEPFFVGIHKLKDNKQLDFKLKGHQREGDTIFFRSSLLREWKQLPNTNLKLIVEMKKL